MSKLRIGQKVRTRHRGIVGVVIVVNGPDVTIQMENGRTILRHADVCEPIGPIPLDWSAPLYTDTGLGPVELNTHGYGWGVDDETGRAMWYGWVDPSAKGDGTWWFEDGTPARPSRYALKLTNVEPKIMIDWKKPLYVKSVHGERTMPGDRNSRRGVTVLSTTARPSWDGSKVSGPIVTLAVQPGPNEEPVLIFRTLDNKPLPGEMGKCGSAVVFANVPERVVRFAHVEITDGDLTERHLDGDNVEFHFEDGKLTAAKLL